MSISPIRRTLGIGWFATLALATATVIISTDAEVGSLRNALSLSNIPAIFLFAVPLSMVAIPSFILFCQRRWMWGIGVAIALSLLSWVTLQTIQTTASPLTLRETLLLIPRIAAVLGGWTVLVSLPPALLLSR